MDTENPEENRESFAEPVDSREIVEQRGVRCTNCGKNFDRGKIFCPVCGLRYTEDAKLPSDTLITRPGLEYAGRSARVFSLLSLILGIVGGVTVIGWLLAIIFGFTALNIIRRRGGFARDRKFALWGITLGFMWPAIIAVSILLFSYHSMTAKGIRRNEISIMNELQNIGITQKYVKSGHFFDRDNDGESEYANLADLSQINYIYFDPVVISGEKCGYSIEMDVLKEIGFRIRAHPLAYRTTGRRSFYVDETGFLRGGNIKGEHTFRDWRKLPKLKKSSIFGEFDDEIADDLMNLARKLAKERDFDRARKILAEVKGNFYMSPAASEVSSIIESMNRYIADDEAKESYQKAVKLVEDKKYEMALAILEDVEKSHPDSLIIPDVKRKRGEIEKTLAETLEKEARELFSEAQQLEVEGKYDEALVKYQSIVREFDSTSHLSRAKDLIPVVEKKREEKKAEALFAPLSKLKAEEDCNEIIHTIGLLMSDYSESDLVNENKDYLNLLQKTAIGHREKDRAKEEFEKQHFQTAIQAAEKALSANPGLEEELKPVLQASYIKLAEDYFKNESFAGAVPYYEKWMKLSGEERSTEHKHYIESLFQIGKSAYLSGKHKEAKEGLLKLMQYLSDRSEFWYLLGSISATEEDYGEAMSSFWSALQLDDRNLKAWYKKGLCRLPEIEKLEEQLPKQLEKINSLKRGIDVIIETTKIINDVNTKHIEFGIQARPKLLPNQKQLLPDQIRKKKLVPAERAKFLTQMRTKAYTLESTFGQNQDKRKQILSTMKEVCKATSIVHSDLKKALSDTDVDPDLSRLIALTSKKRQCFQTAYYELKAGLDHENRFEERALRCVKSAVYSFDRGQAISRYVEEIDGFHESFSRLQMTKKISEGSELVKKGISVKISFKDYLGRID